MKLAISLRRTASNASSGKPAGLFGLVIVIPGNSGERALAHGRQDGGVGLTAFVGADGGSGGARLVARLRLMEEVDDQLGGVPVAARGLVGQLGEGRLQLG